MNLHGQYLEGGTVGLHKSQWAEEIGCWGSTEVGPESWVGGRELISEKMIISQIPRRTKDWKI